MESGSYECQIQLKHDDQDSPKCCWKFDPAYNRFIALFYLCFLGFLGLMCYDSPAPLQSNIEEIFSIKAFKYEYLYSFYSFPNIVLCLFAGILIDKVFGVKYASYLVGFLGLLGNVIVAIGAFAKTYWVMLLGRFIFGMGGDTFGVVANYYAIVWFAGKELNFVFGMMLSLMRLGSSVIFLIAVPLYNFWLSQSEAGHSEYALGATLSFGIAGEILFFLIILALAWESQRNGKLKAISEDGSSMEQMRFRDILTFPFKYWLVIVVSHSFNVAGYVFVSCSQQLLMNKYKLSASEANHLGSIFNLISAFTSPIPGFIVDKVGKQVFFLMFGLGIGVVSQIILAFTDWNPYVSIIFFAVSIGTLNSCCSPLLSLIVKPYQLGTAYGILASTFNIVQTLSNLLAGFLLSHYGYFAPCIFYLTLLATGLLSATLLWILDKRDKGILNLTAHKKKLAVERMMNFKEDDVK